MDDLNGIPRVHECTKIVDSYGDRTVASCRTNNCDVRHLKRWFKPDEAKEYYLKLVYLRDGGYLLPGDQLPISITQYLTKVCPRAIAEPLIVISEQQGDRLFDFEVNGQVAYCTVL